MWLFLAAPWAGLRCVIVVFHVCICFLKCVFVCVSTKYYSEVRLSIYRSFKLSIDIRRGAQWLSGRVHDSRPRGRVFEPHRCHCVVSLTKNTNSSLVPVQPRKTRPYITERLMMRRKESNQTNKNIFRIVSYPFIKFASGFLS